MKLDTFVDALHLAEKITGVPAPRIQVAPSIMKMMAATMGVVEKVVPIPPDYSSEYLRISAGVTYIGSNAKAKSAWGYDPRPLEDGLKVQPRHAERSEASGCRWRQTLRFAQGDKAKIGLLNFLPKGYTVTAHALA